MLRRLAPLLVLTVIAVAACGFAITTGTTSSTTLPDGGPITADASPGDDAGAERPDGAADDGGGEGGPSSAIGFCANELVRHEVCVDFDQTDAGGLALGGPLGDAVATIGPERASSAPNSLRVASTLLGSQSYLFKTWGTTRAQIDVAFDVYAAGTGYSQIGGIEIFGPNILGSYQVMFASDAGQLLWFEAANAASLSHALPATTTQPAWHRVDMHVELIADATQKSRVRIRYDGATAFDATLNAPIPTITNVKADVGPLFYSAKAAPVVVFIDNVTIDSRP